MNDLLYIGYITGPFGIKGEVKIISESNHLDKIFKVKNILVIDDKKYTIKSARFHKNAFLVLFEGINSISDINSLCKKDVYVSKASLNLKNDEYLNIELFSYLIKEDENTIGNVDEILYNKANLFVKSKNLIIPLNEKYLVKVDVSNHIIYVKNTKELIL